jgi:PAS domain S-box-containing protein
MLDNISKSPAQPSEAWQSEELFRQLVKGAKDYAIFMLDLQGKVVTWNTGAELITGYTEAEIIGQHMSILYTQEEVENKKPTRELHVALSEGSIEDEGWRKRKDGALFWGNVVITLIEDINGRARGFSLVTKDITERKKAETMLLESEARMGAILAAAVDAIIIIDERGIIESLNIAAEKLFEYKAVEMVGQNVKMLMPSPYRAEHDGYLHNYNHTGIKKIIGIGREVVGLRKSGGTFPMDLAVSEVDMGGRRVFTGIVRDITERKKAEDQLLESDARTRAILAAAVDAIITIDERGSIESLNGAAERLFGYASAEMIGQNVKMLMPAPYRGEHDGYLYNYTTTGVKKIIGSGREVVGLRKNGDTFPMDLAVSEVALGGRRLFTGIVRDISERKKAEAQLIESDTRTRAILAAAVDAIIIIDELGIIESLNGAAERLFRYSSEEMVGQNVKMLMPSPYRGEHDGYLKNYITTGIRKIIGSGREVLGLRKDGETFPMDLAVSEVALGGRRVFTGIVRDISERKKAESQLLESDARTRAILAAAVDAIIIIDELGKIESLNGAAEMLFGYLAEEMVGNNVKMLMPAPYRGEHDSYLSNYTTTGIKKIIGSGREVMGLRKNGDTFPMDLAVSEVQIGGRRLFTGIVRDITERKKAEAQLLENAAELRERNEDLLRSNQELDAFAYIASHDLKEPLRGIHNYASFLIDDYADKLDEEGKDKLETLKRLSQRLDGLLDSLLEISRLGRVDFLPKEFDLDVVMHEIIDSLQISLTERNVSVKIPRPLPRVRGDAVLLGEVLRNLITNGMKYNEKPERWIEIGYTADPPPKASGQARLSASASASARSIALYVRDNGIGIPEKHFEAIFRIFKRLHSRDAYGGGTGVGLAITKKVIERHGGDIWLESEPGVGTTFYFTLQGLEAPL